MSSVSELVTYFLKSGLFYSKKNKNEPVDCSMEMEDRND